jgi:hypothetical protein
VLRGERYGGVQVPTPDSFGVVVGQMLLAPPEVVDSVIKHVRNYVPPTHDLRVAVRKVEARLFSRHAGALAGSQALDFKKQDPMTEIEESLEANEVSEFFNCVLTTAK